MSKRTCGLLLSLLLLCCPSLQTAAHAQAPVKIEKDLVYGTGGGVELTLDLARPARGSGPFPALLYIHGGSWVSGSKEDFDFPLTQAAARGYVAVSVNYRLAAETREDGKPRYPFPAQINDVKCAVRWLRANAGKYRIDPDHVGALGFSAGGHLALLLAFTEPSDGLEGTGGHGEYSSRVQAAVNSAGPTLFAPFTKAEALTRLLGGTYEEVPEAWAEASPLTYVRRDNPPVLTLQGDRDELVSVELAFLLDARMKEAGASHTLVVKEGVGHESLHDDPAAWAFLDRILKVAPSHDAGGR
jgi:acetyl esterase/lipase